MKKDQLEFLKTLLAAHGPSGYEETIRAAWRKRVEKFADTVTTDVMGNCIATLNPNGSPKVLLAGHCDEIGFQVSHIDDKGFLFFRQIGGHDLSIVPGRRVLIHTHKGPLAGVTGKKAIHLMSPEDRKKIPEVHELWIDIGAKDKDEAASLVELGDSVTHDLGYQELRNNLVASRALDNRTGAFVAAETLVTLARGKGKLAACVVAVATVHEEIGLRGAITAAYGTNPDIGICIDVTHATDSPGLDPKKDGVVKLGAGPTLTRGAAVNAKLTRHLIELAKKEKIPYQIEANPGRVGNDTWSIQVARAGVTTADIGIPLRYMHTPSEVGSLEDLAAVVKLLSAFCGGLKKGARFGVE